MLINNEDTSFYQYAIISYAHDDIADVTSEFETFDKNGICYWFDENMPAGEDFVEQFNKMFDKEKCKCVVFFVSDEFFLSKWCAGEMQHFKEKCINGNSNKFCLFVIPKDYPYGSGDESKEEKDIEEIYYKIDDYVHSLCDEKKQERRKQLPYLKDRIKLFLEINTHGRKLYGTLGNVNDYVGENCKKGKLFYNAGIILAYKQITYESFGFFPQTETQKAIEASEIETEYVKRNADKASAYYAPIDWIVIGGDDQSQTLLSKELLYVINYVDLMYPINSTSETIDSRITKIFFEHLKFNPDEYRKKIKKVRFLTKDELDALLKCCQRDMAKKREILLPEPTFFAKISNRINVPAFWLAGDMNDARRVDAATESLSDQKAGVELYYVRIVIEVEK